MSAEKPAEELEIKTLLQKAKVLAKDSFPEGKLENRLLNLGLEEFIHRGVERGLKKYGFPFKFSGQLDEAILVLAHFLDRFKDEGGTLKIYVLNNLANGDDLGLSYWQSAKAKLYLELQNLILQLDGLKWNGIKENKEVEITWNSEVIRIFTFRKMVDIAYLTQPAISAMIEQLAAGIEIGFLFSETFNAQSHNGYPKRSLGSLFANTMIVDFHPSLKKRIHDFYIFQDQTGSNYLPYQERCKAKWFSNFKKANSKEKHLKALLALFNKKHWKEFAANNDKHICYFENQGTELFNRATVMLYKAFVGSPIAREMSEDGYEDPDQYITDKINETVIPDDFIEIQRTMSVFDQAEDIWAVDASSTKKSLKVHESSPTYRQWIRKSLNRVLNPKQVLRTQGKSLKRIYILKDTDVEDKDIEFSSLQRIMQYYFDYYRYDISEMTSIVKIQPSDSTQEPKDNQPWLEEYWDSLRDRIHIYVTTSSVLKKAVEYFDVGKLSEILGEIFSTVVSPDEIPTYLGRLDYLFTKYMIYNFTNPRANPEEFKIEAAIYRSVGSFNKATENNVLFKITGGNLPSLDERQKNFRMLSLIKVLEKYEARHTEILKNLMTVHKAKINEIRAKLSPNNMQDVQPLYALDSVDLLGIRQDYEDALHKHFKSKFALLHRLLELFSVEVSFFSDPSKEAIKQVYPFNKAKTVKGLSNVLMKEVKKRKAQIEALNKELISLDSKEEQMMKETRIFLSYAREDKDKVDKIYERLRKEGYAPWQDTRDLVPGENWSRAIQRAIKNADFFMVCLSTNSANKRGVLQKELKQALEVWKGMLLDDIYLIPARLDECEVPEDLKENFNYTDLFKDGDWNEEGWNRLLMGIKTGLERRKKK